MWWLTTRTITRVTGSGHHDDELFEGGDLFADGWDGEEEEEQGPPAPTWRRPFLVVIAVVTAVALAMVPLYNVLFAATEGDDGLDVCGFDYCVVQEVVRQAGMDLTMSRLSHVFLDEEEARELANLLTDHLRIDRVGLVVVEDLDGRIGGVYDRADRSISIESPARAWTVLHEVAHAVQTGHGEEFQAVVLELTGVLESWGPEG